MTPDMNATVQLLLPLWRLDADALAQLRDAAAGTPERADP